MLLLNNTWSAECVEFASIVIELVISNYYPLQTTTYRITKLITSVVWKGKCTVEPLLTDTPEKRTPMTILKVPTVLPFTSILKQPLKSGHLATAYNGQLSRSQLYASNTQ